MTKPRIGRPPSPKGTPPIRGQMRWHDDEWEQIQAVLKATGETYSAFIRRLVLKSTAQPPVKLPKRRRKG